MKRIGTGWIIHGFAALHVAVVVVCALLGWPDSLLLTALTMFMTVVICLRRNLTVEFTAVCVVLVNILGYLLGHVGAELFNFTPEIVNNILATFLTTELIGWALDLFARTWNVPTSVPGSWKENLGWLVFAVIAVFALRLFIELFIFRGAPFKGVDIVGAFRSFLGNSLVVLAMFVGTLFFIRTGHDKHYSLDVATIGTTLFIGLIAVLGALLHSFGLPFHWTFPLDPAALSRNIVVALLVEMTLFGLTYMVEYAVNIRRELGTQRERRHLAEYRYMALKNQVNPHFLFNSLNILDAIVQDGEKEEASLYIHKLAGIYRYMLQHDNQKLVTLGEEVTFVTMYADLLRVRFPEGFSRGPESPRQRPLPEGRPVHPAAPAGERDQAQRHLRRQAPAHRRQYGRRVPDDGERPHPAGLGARFHGPRPPLSPETIHGHFRQGNPRRADGGHLPGPHPPLVTLP